MDSLDKAVWRDRDDISAWAPRAACKGADTRIFYVDAGQSSVQAKAVCAVCPVKKECLDYAVRNGEGDGIWGGLAPKERSRYRRGLPLRQRERRHGIPSTYINGCRCDLCREAETARMNRYRSRHTHICSCGKTGPRSEMNKHVKRLDAARHTVTPIEEEGAA